VARAVARLNLGAVLVQTGELADARSHLESALVRVEVKPNLLPYVLLGFGGLLARQGDAETAGLLLGAVQDDRRRAERSSMPGETPGARRSLCGRTCR